MSNRGPSRDRFGRDRQQAVSSVVDERVAVVGAVVGPVRRDDGSDSPTTGRELRSPCAAVRGTTGRPEVSDRVFCHDRPITGWKFLFELFLA